MPDVETIQVAASESDAKIDSDGYESYFTEAQVGAMYENPSDDEGIAPFASSTGTIFRTGLKLGYSFYKVVHLQKGEEAPSIMTKSKTPHVIDVVLIGTPSSSYHKPEYKPAPDYDNKILYPDIVNPDDWQIDTTTTEFDQPFTWVKPHIMEMYNWSKTARSSGSYYKASLDVEVPYDAYCLVRVRTQEEGILGMLNEVSIIDDYKGLEFEDEPICFTKAKCELPGDSVTTYLTMTNCYDPETDDPMLFMHNTDGNVVGFNDNGTVNVIYNFTKAFDLSSRDAVLTQSYKAPTGYVSVCSKKTLETYSKCSILSGLDAYEELAAIINNKYKSADANQEGVKDVTISKAVGISSDIEISSESGNIGYVKAYDVFGNFVGSAKGNAQEANIPVSSLNIYKGGIYIVSVETPNGIQTERIVVR